MSSLAVIYVQQHYIEAPQTFSKFQIGFLRRKQHCLSFLGKQAALAQRLCKVNILQKLLKFKMFDANTQLASAKNPKKINEAKNNPSTAVRKL